MRIINNTSDWNEKGMKKRKLPGMEVGFVPASFCVGKR